MVYRGADPVHSRRQTERNKEDVPYVPLEVVSLQKPIGFFDRQLAASAI